MRKTFEKVSQFLEDSDNRYLVLMMAGGVALSATVYISTIAVRLACNP